MDIQEERYVVEQMLELPDPSDTTEWLVEGLIVKSGLNYLTAAAGHGKSLVSLDLAHACIHGRKFLGLFDVPKTNVLYIDQDGNNKRELNKRVLAFGFEANGEFFRMNQQGLRLDVEEDALWLLDACRSRYIGLVILDALVRFHRGSETNPADMAVVRQNLQHLTAAGITVLMIHHNSRRGTVRGGMEIIAMADCMISLKKASKTARRFTLSIEKERTESNIDWSHIDIVPTEVDGRVELSGRTYMSSDDDGDDLADAILDYCEGEGHTKPEIRKEVGGDATKVDAAIQRLLDEGRLGLEQHGRRKVYTAVESSAEDDVVDS